MNGITTTPVNASATNDIFNLNPEFDIFDDFFDNNDAIPLDKTGGIKEYTIPKSDHEKKKKYKIKKRKTQKNNRKSLDWLLMLELD